MVESRYSGNEKGKISQERARPRICVAISFESIRADEPVIENIPAGNARIEQALHELEHEGRLTAAPHSDANRGLPWLRRDLDPPRCTDHQLGFLKIEDDLF